MLSGMKRLAATFLLFATVVFGQERYGALQGTIADDTDAVLPGVEVTLTNKTTSRTFTATAGPYGDYTLRNVEPGRYAVTFSLAGFSRAEVPDINILAAQTFKLDVTLKAGPVTTTIQVVDDVPLIDPLSAVVVHAIPQEEFEELPKGRSFQSLAITAPGVNTGEIEGGIQVNGASGAENAFLIDGIVTTSAIDGRSRQNAVFEYLSELQIKTAGVEADYAGALGGVITAITRSGGNAFHGDVWYYHNGDRFAAAPPQRLVLDPTDNLTVSHIQDQKNRTRAHEAGFSFGGPIRQDRLFFFTSWSPRWNRQTFSYNFSNGTEPGTLQREQTFWSGFNKISFEPSSRVRGHLSWLWSPFKSEGSLPVYNAACANCISSSAAANAMSANRSTFNPQSSYTAHLDYAWSNSLLLSARAGYFWDNYKEAGVPPITSVRYETPALGPLVPPAQQGPVGVENTPRLQQLDHDRIARSTAQFDAGTVLSFFGRHSVKAGFGVEKSVNDVNRFYPGGYVSVFWDRSFAGVSGQANRGIYGYYEVNDVRTQGSTGATMQSIYGHDRWRVNEHLTLNIGVRLESEQVPSFNAPLQPVAIKFGWGERVAPRIGGGYDLHGDGKLKIFASWGRYFDWTKFDLARSVFGAEIFRTYYRGLDTLDVFSLSLNNMPGQDLWNPGVTEFRDRRSVAAGLASVAPGLKPMSQDQWSLGTDIQWNMQTAVGVRYLHQELKHVVEDLAVNIQGNFAYIYANPGEGIARAVPFVTTLTPIPLDYPTPVRQYDAVELTVRRRFSDNWFGDFSYTWSRLYGNYSGPASSDEILPPTTGLAWPTAQQAGGSIAHPARYANLAWDLDQVLFDADGNLDVRGRLATDRPHVFKWNGGYEFNTFAGRTSLGMFMYLGSGTPLTTRVHTNQAVPVFVNGRGDMGRTPMLNFSDLQLAHRVELAESQSVRLEFTVLNVFNQKTVRHRFESLNRGLGLSPGSSSINLSSTNLRDGYDYDALIRATPDGTDAFDPRYGMDDLFSEGLTARLGLKWSF
jgi:hypothetical protein